MRHKAASRGIGRRAANAPYSDGVLDLFVGLLLLGLAALWSVGSGALIGLIALPIILGGSVALRAVKQRITDPRIGYVEPATPRGSTAGSAVYLIGGLVLFCVAIWLGGGFGDGGAWRRASPVLSGYLIAGAMWYLAESSRAVRYRVLSGLSVLLGIGVWWFADDGTYGGMAVYLAAMGAAMLLVGSATFATFLAAHPADPGAGA